jgi:NADPH:quinone reductase-like Zn-dependent oxidoreductase
MNDPKASTSAPMLTEIVLPGLVGPEGLKVHQRPVPAPGHGQALVEVLATGVSFAEQQMRRGRYLNQPKFPFVLGYDLVGVVTAVGPMVDASLVGRRVAAVVKTGGWATHALVDAGHLVPVPDGLDAAEAETVVLNGITAWQMLKKAKVDSGQTILVHGANGGVGNTLVQLARHAGIRVIGTAAPRHHDALRAMGAEPIDYNDPHLADRARQFALGSSRPGGSTRFSTRSVAQVSSGRSSSWHAEAHSWLTEPPASGTTPTTCLPRAWLSTAGSESGTSCPMGATPSSTTSGAAR